MRNKTKKKLISLGQSVDGQELTLEIDIVEGANGELLINKHKITAKSEAEIEEEQNEAITKLLDSINFSNAISKKVIENKPADHLLVEDFDNLPTEVIANEFDLKNVIYKKPNKGKLAKNVELHFFHETKLFITTFDLEFKYTYEEYMIEEITENDITIDESILTMSPMVLQSGETSFFKTTSPFDKIVSVRSYTTPEDHNTTTPVVNIIVQVKNPISNGQEFFTKSIIYKSTPFSNSDVEYIMDQVEQIGNLSAQTIAPPENISDFQIDYAPIIEEGCEVIGTKPAQNYDKNSNEIPVVLTIRAYGIIKEIGFTVVFEQSFNENLIKTLTKEDINLDVLKNIISTDDPSFDEEIFDKWLINKSGVTAAIEHDSLETSPDDKRQFSVNIEIIAGKWKSIIHVDGQLGIGTFPLSLDGVIKNHGNGELPKELISAVNSYNFGDIHVSHVAQQSDIIGSSAEAINKTRVINIS